MNTKNIFPGWLNEFKRFLPLKTEFFLYGNVYDCYYFPVNYKDVDDEKNLNYIKFPLINDLLQNYLFLQGFEVVCYFDIIDGLKVESKDKSINTDNLLSELHITNKDAQSLINNAKAKKLDDAIGLFRILVSNYRKLSASIINYTSRFTSDPNTLENEVKPIFLKMLKAAQESVLVNQQKNILIFICDKLNDIPPWILLENPLTKGIEIQKPDREERIRFFNQRCNQFYSEGNDTNKKELLKIFPDLTDNFTNLELENLITISKKEKIHINNIKEIIDLFKYGERENPWETIEADKIENAEQILRRRVLGQDKAIKKAVEIIRRSKLGLNDIDKNKPSNKPKGILFFAGPTGTGKTELAKSLAELIFSDEEAIIRFDMSEYNDSNSDVKLIGSPPGYVGYEEGGQLTDAIRKKPFSIVLFDEIEKAHPKIFDKFLQILDDGRLTDGKGQTVYFSQSLIIFTSNLGIYKELENGKRILNVEYGESYDVIEENIKTEIKDFFGVKLGRPEIFNRFGDNFVVFDFIQPDIAMKIIKKHLITIKENLKKSRNIDFNFNDDFIKGFLEINAKDNLEMGGRGIVNRIETYIKNGLTNYLFEINKTTDCTINIKMENSKVIFE